MHVLIAVLYLDIISLNNLVKGDKGDTGSLQSLNQHVASSDTVLKSLEGEVISLKGKLGSFEKQNGEVVSLKARVGSVENKLETIIEQENTIIKFLNSLTLVLDEKLPK